MILRSTVVNACSGVPELEFALFHTPTNTEKLFSDLRSSIETLTIDPHPELPRALANVLGRLEELRRRYVRCIYALCDDRV